MKMRGNTLRNLMLTMLVLGVAGSVVGVGTFATFNASVTSTGNTFSAGSYTFTATETGGTCSDVTGAAATGTCTAVLSNLNGGPVSSMVPGDSWITYTTLTNANASTGAITATLGLADAGTAGELDNNSIDSNNTTSSQPTGLGLVVFECQTNAGADVACSGATLQKLVVIYGNCGGGAGTVLTRGSAAAIATSDVTQPGSTDNGIKVFGTECFGGDNNATVAGNGIKGSTINLIGSGLPATSLAKNTSYNLLMLFYLPNIADSTVSASGGTPNLTATFTANSLAGTSH